MQPVVEIAASGAVLARWPQPLAALTTAERERAGALRRGRDDFLAAHLLARECVAALTRLTPAEVVLAQRCERCGGPHGRPSVVGRPDVYVSWAHSAGVVLAAACDRAVGVDVEVTAALHGVGHPDDGLLARVATAAEAERIRSAPDPVEAMLRVWVGKEALVKAGVLAIDDFGSVELDQVRGFVLAPVRHPGAVAAVALQTDG